MAWRIVLLVNPIFRDVLVVVMPRCCCELMRLGKTDCHSLHWKECYALALTMGIAQRGEGETTLS